MSYFYNPVAITFGQSSLEQLPQILSEFGKRVLFLSGGEHLENNSAFNDIYHKIKPYICQTVSVFDVRPDIADVLSLILKCTGKYDAVLAIGDGRVLDIAKAFSCLYGNRSQSVDGLRKAIDSKKFLLKKLPVIAVPTSSGTGSETNQWATIWDQEGRRSHLIGDYSLYPKYAVIDPRLSVNVSPSLTVSAGLDVLSHAAEGMWAKKSNTASRLYAAKAMSLVFDHLELAAKNPDNLRHRDKMAEASALMGVSLSVAETTICHALSIPLTLEYGMEWGIAGAASINDVLQYNKGSFEDEQIFIELVVKGLQHQSLANYIKNVCSIVSLPVRLADYGIAREKLSELAEKAYNPDIVGNNPKEATVDDLLNILKKIY